MFDCVEYVKVSESPDDGEEDYCFDGRVSSVPCERLEKGAKHLRRDAEMF